MRTIHLLRILGTRNGLRTPTAASLLFLQAKGEITRALFQAVEELSVGMFLLLRMQLLKVIGAIRFQFIGGIFSQINANVFSNVCHRLGTSLLE